MANTIKAASKVNWPTSEPQENFSFSVNDTSGIFEFKFKWLNNRWNCWVTLPDGSVRQAGVYPNVASWTGFLDYGLVFITDLQNINLHSSFKLALLTKIFYTLLKGFAIITGYF